MPQYIYSAIDENGKTVSGSMEAGSKEQLIQRIKVNGLFVLSADDKAEIKQSKQIEIGKKASTKSLAIFCRQFATLINAGITAVKSLDILYQQTEDKRLKESVGRIYDSVQKGESMSEAFRRQGSTYPEIFINMILSGESSGSLDTVLVRLAEHFEKENKLNNKIKSAMTYPIILSVLSIVVVIVMVVFILPTFLEMIISNGGEIPLPTKIVLGLSNLIKSYWWLIIGIITIIVIGLRAYVRSEKGRLWWDNLKLKFPVVHKSINMIYTARFARTLSTLLSSGIQMLPSLEITSRVIGNKVIYNRLLLTIEEIRKGVSLSMSMKKIDIFPPMIYNMINVGEETGLLDDILSKTAAFYDEESDSAIQRLVGLLEPMLIIVMGLVIGFIVIAMYLPMLGMFSAVS